MSQPTANRKPDLLIVDDDPSISDILSFVLSRDFNVRVADSRTQARTVVRDLEEPPALALVDLGLPPTPHRPDEGFRLISELVAYAPDIKIVVLSGQSDEANARHARTLGAIEFVAKPVDPPALKHLLLQALRINAVEKSATVTSNLIGVSAPVEKLRSQIAQFAASPFPVLVHGESGTGKELVARALHERSPRAANTLYALNCAAISPTLVEPTLFGYAKGAFTGAQSARAGYFEDAHESTLFLDEIGELPLDLQAKLLRVMENGEFQRVGETMSRSSNARVVAATNRDLKQEIRAGRFRADLYHRLSVFTIDVPPLRELGDDRLMLLDHFREFYARQSGMQPFTLDARAREVWVEYVFPGNVRELRNIVIRLSTKCAGQAVNEDQLRAELDSESDLENAAGTMPLDENAVVDSARRQLQTARGFKLDETLARWERGYVEAALDLTQGNLARAAKLLGVNRTTLYSRMQNYNMNGSNK
jgi:DNA-binding NtrC family response regulator